jgi:aspartyl-tRNA synthetase
VVIENEEMMNEITEYNCESTLQITGVVRERSNKTTTMATGEIEVVPTSVTLLGLCQYAELPFEINHSKEASENTRLKYRFLDLRNPLVKEKIILRSMVVASLRRRMTEQGFLEITTPILTCSSPEGARDYLVPSRNHPGKFYALPQAPQQFKQLLMASGFDRYFQIAPCFRDEDARADRTPGEFYQLDMEMAFASQEDIFSVIEEVLPPVFEEFGAFHEKINTPFRRISYLDAIAKYGSDKPDLRIDLELTDVSELLGGCGFPPFESNGESNPSIQAIVVRDFAPTRKQIDKLCADVEVETGQKAYWFRVDEAGVFVGGISKFLQEKASFIQESLSLQPGDFIGLTSGTRDVARKTAGVLRKYLGNAAPNHMNKEKYEFCWIVDFPMYEMGEESGVLEFCHNPFSMPQGGMNALQNQDPLSILAYQYDLVCNGYETASGAVRNHEPKMMIEAFKLAGLNEDVVKSKFPALYNAFCYGAPPHAGIAPGVDRMIMLLAGEESIREVIPFPMNKTAMDVMMGAPSEVEKRQLKDVHIKLDLPVEEVQV